MRTEENLQTDRPGTLYDVVQRWAACAPDAPVFVAEGQGPLTYQGLAALMDRFRRSLGQAGFGRSDRIAICHSGGAAMAATILGVASCATAVPLPADCTVGEFAIHLHDRKARALIVETGLETPARAAAAQLKIPVHEVAPADECVAGAVDLRIASGAADGPVPPATPDDLIFVLATSGTTAHGKIVPVRQRKLVIQATSTATVLELDQHDRCLCLQPLTYASGLYNLCASLVSGGSVAFLPRFDVSTFFRYLAALEPTWYTGSYTFQHNIHASAPAHQGEIRQSRLRFIRTSSGALESNVADGLESLFNVPVIEAYSTTETGRIAGNPLPPQTRKRGSVGRPIFAEVAIVGVDGKPLPAGQNGEILVRGEQIFDGYEGDPTANKAAFVDGWYRTGDEGVLDEDGYLWLTSRVKDFINRGGEKIAPAEIEAALRRHPDVAMAVAFPVPHVTLGQDVCAAVVPESGTALTDETLTEFLRGRLASVKTPRRYVFVDEIPKGPTGKYQRLNLAAAFGLIEDAAGERSALSDDARRATPLEAKLQRLWAGTLGLDHVGLHDDFFVLGGDSLQAVELFMAIERDLDRRLPRSVLFEAVTVAQMAQRIENATPPRCLVEIQPNGDRPPFFCVHDGDGQVLNFRALARHVGEAQPFIGIQCFGLDGEDVPFTRIEDMAAHYIGEMRKVQPSGPYFLGGYSFGGRIAYVIAQQLHAAGETVALLALFDTYCHLGQRRVRPGEWLGRHRDRLRALRLPDVPAYVALRAKNLAVMAFMASRLRIFSAAWRFYESRNRPIPRFMRRPVEANDMIRRDYRPRPFDGNATLFKAELYAWNHPDSHDGWHQLIEGDLEVIPIPGRHFEIMKVPHVQVLARALSGCLQRAQAAYLDAPDADAPVVALKGVASGSGGPVHHRAEPDPTTA